MKTSQQCPKCQSADILTIPGRVTTGDGTPMIMLGWLRHVTVARYICERCGYMEQWVDSMEKLPLLKAFLNKRASRS